MKLTPEIADRIFASYGRAGIGALNDLLRKHGLAILTDEARRELILTLGEDRRGNCARNLWHRNGGDTSRPWSRAYSEWLRSKFRAAPPAPLASAAE